MVVMSHIKYLFREQGAKNKIAKHIAGHLILSLSLVACGVATNTQAIDNTIEFSNEIKIAAALYNNNRVPGDFYQEDYPENLFGSVSHVKNIDLVINDGLPEYELASNDFVEAMEWDEQAAVAKDFYDQLVDVSETALYYQFTRVNPDLPELIYMSRVFKETMLDRAGVDRSDEDGEYKGKITLIEITAADVKFIVEYLWIFTFSNNYSNAILESYTLENDDEFIHIMTQAKLDFSYNDGCDTVNLYEVRYTVPKATGLIWRDKEFIGTFLATRNNNLIEICR